MAVRATERRRAKISVTVDPQLLKVVDAFVAELEGWDRSKVIEEALRLWCAREQERAMEEQYAAPQSSEEQEERAAWREIQAAAAGRIFQRH
jgi:metal-responsive CopG/Arc/MetJ family transcriptional regulator